MLDVTHWSAISAASMHLFALSPFLFCFNFFSFFAFVSVCCCCRRHRRVWRITHFISLFIFALIFSVFFLFLFFFNLFVRVPHQNATTSVTKYHPCIASQKVQKHGTEDWVVEVELHQIISINRQNMQHPIVYHSPNRFKYNALFLSLSLSLVWIYDHDSFFSIHLIGISFSNIGLTIWKRRNMFSIASAMYVIFTSVKCKVK